MNNHYFDTNKSLWNQKVDYHKASDFYELDNFKKGLFQPLRDIELRGLPDVRGKSLLHLQCHFGQDTLAWARLGAKVTGVDLSNKGIESARQLRDELKLDAKFVNCNVFDTRKHIQEQFDIVFTSYGVIGWLPDLKPWAKVIKESLKPGGTFYIVEFHPALMMHDHENYDLQFHYFNRPEPDEYLIEGTYADKNANLQHKEFTWSHSLSEIITPLINEGLILESFNEYPYCNWNCFPNLRTEGEQRFVYNGVKFSFPHLFELKMRRG